MYGFFLYCGACGVLWNDAADTACWLCGALGVQCNDDFVYTADSMSTGSEL
jgi:aerobic-type carbon monoxide dehydrogenase small subunit (CoxS/CutS family)